MSSFDWMKSATEYTLYDSLTVRCVRGSRISTTMGTLVAVAWPSCHMSMPVDEADLGRALLPPCTLTFCDLRAACRPRMSSSVAKQCESLLIMSDSSPWSDSTMALVSRSSGSASMWRFTAVLPT